MTVTEIKFMSFLTSYPSLYKFSSVFEVPNS